MHVDVLTNVRSKQKPFRLGVVVETKKRNGKHFYRILWDDNWETGDAMFYEQKDFEVLSSTEVK